MTDRLYKYRREDFGELPVTLHHLTIYLNFLDGFVEASNCLEMTARQPLERIELDAKDLTIVRVEWVKDPLDPSESAVPLRYDYAHERDKLIVALPDRVDSGQRFLVRTVTRCVPSDHILEGIYKDTTPHGAPQQYISQCQQWGFQRIMPIFDDCTAKCAMTTTIEADARYTHLITNGNINPRTNPDGAPVLKPGDPSRQIITYENPLPMAPYLFLVCAGTWDMLADQVTCDSGRTVRLEYLVPPGRVEGAQIPMEILKKSVLWVAQTQDYEYAMDVYRTICMNKSNFGGMENMGNTTIVTDAALIDEHTLDQQLIYAHAVIGHEFEHNQCGSETTMETPFDVWLNEAYTVDVERQFVAEIFDPTFVRLAQVDSIRSPLLGPLSIEDSGRAGRIVRDGFNNPDELIDGVTYVKAAEVIRMLRLILGPELFKAATTLYFSRYKNSNANTEQFFECFEEASGRSLEQFKKGWLYTIGYPKVTAEMTYRPESRSCALTLRQESDSGAGPFHLPIEVALVDAQGRNVPGAERVLELAQAQMSSVFEHVPESPAFASVNRGYSFYGTFTLTDATAHTLSLQVRMDTDPFNRVEAMRQLTDRQRIGLLPKPDAAVDQEWLALWGEILQDESLSPALKAYFLRIDEQPLDRNYCTWFPELAQARETLMAAVNAAHREELLAHFHRLDTYRPKESPNDGIEERILKNVFLELIAVDDSPASHDLILKHFRAATTATDRVAALVALNRSSAAERLSVLEEVYRAWFPHLSAYANYLRIIGAGTREDAFTMIEREKSRDTFDVNQPTWTRALFLTMAANNKMIWTDRGIQWIADTVSWMARINDYNASRMLNTFQHCRRLKPELRVKVQTALEQIIENVPEKISPTIQGQAKAYLADEVAGS
ncbi:MAG: DUF3458 domain-containing protein [Deltaproteobacteria bacterium]|nr:DUF3458 domain-containing protein [Deltaproteobacteria bacterium]